MVVGNNTCIRYTSLEFYSLEAGNKECLKYNLEINLPGKSFLATLPLYEGVK